MLCYRPVYSVSEVATAVLGMMDKMGVRKACFVAHSYGKHWKSSLQLAVWLTVLVLHQM